MLNDEKDNWDKFYRRGEKLLKLAWVGVIGLIFVLAVLTHYNVLYPRIIRTSVITYTGSYLIFL